jgi:hypothetical protein
MPCAFGADLALARSRQMTWIVVALCAGEGDDREQKQRSTPSIAAWDL